MMEFVNGNDDNPDPYLNWKIMDNKIHDPNHQPAIRSHKNP
jgi:hypothetical protein